VLERIGRVTFRFVRVDRDHRHAARRVVARERHHPLLAADDVRAVVAGEADDEDFGVLEARERVVFAVDAGEVEVRGRLVELEGEWHLMLLRLVINE
jgi:hypothetical protein